MAAATVVSAFGTVLQRGDGGGPEAFTSIIEVQRISGPSINRGTIETTHHESPDNFREFLPNLPDGGEITIEGNWCPASATQTTPLVTDFNNQSTRNYKLVFNDAGDAQFAFVGFPTAVTFDSPFDGKMGITATFKVTGKPVFTA